jgi:hypothetical protein
MSVVIGSSLGTSTCLAEQFSSPSAPSGPSLIPPGPGEIKLIDGKPVRQVRAWIEDLCRKGSALSEFEACVARRQNKIRSDYETQVHNNRIELQACRVSEASFNANATPCVKQGCFCEIGSTLLPPLCSRGPNSCCSKPKDDPKTIDAYVNMADDYVREVHSCRERISQKHGTFLRSGKPLGSETTDEARGSNDNRRAE